MVCDWESRPIRIKDHPFFRPEFDILVNFSATTGISILYSSYSYLLFFLPRMYLHFSGPTETTLISEFCMLNTVVDTGHPLRMRSIITLQSLILSRRPRQLTCTAQQKHSVSLSKTVYFAYEYINGPHRQTPTNSRCCRCRKLSQDGISQF